MLLNGIRQRLEAALEERERALADEELDRRLREEVIDVTLPGEELPLGHLHPITQVRRAVEDAFLGLGYEVRDDREVETVEYNFDKLAFLPTHSARSPRDTFFFDDDARAAHGDEPVADPHPRGEAAADLHGLDRPRLPPRRDHRDALSDLPPVRGARGRPGADARRPEGDAAARDARALRARPARALPHALLPVHRAVDRARRVVRHLRRRGLPHLQVLRLDRDGRRRHGRPARSSRTSASTRRSGAGSRSAAGSSAPRSCATTSPTSARSGKATCAC